MNKFVIVILTLTFIGSCQLKPATDTIITAFETGKERSYTLINDVTLNDYKGGPPIGYRITGIVKAGSIWGNDEEKLLKFTLITPKLNVQRKHSKQPNDFIEHSSYLDTAVNEEFFAHWKLGEIKSIFVHAKEDPSFINLKKAIVSLFQYQLLDGEYDEIDVSGKCFVNYSSKSKLVYEKNKRNCVNDDLPYHKRYEPAVGVNIVSKRVIEFRVTQDGILEKVESHESHRFGIAANENVGSIAESIFSLKFDGSISNIATIHEDNLKKAIKSLPKGVKKDTLLTDVLVPLRRKDDTSIKTIVKILKDDLTTEKIGSADAALALVKIIPIARRASKEDLLKILKAHTMQDIRGQLIDILAAAQTKDSHDAAREILKFDSIIDDISNDERYLQGLAVGTRPQEYTMTNLFDLYKSKKITDKKMQDTLIQTIAAMAHRFAHLPGNSFNTEIVKKIQNFILKELEKCPDTECKELYIRALHNLQSNDTIDILLKFVRDKFRTVSVAAMKAIKSFPTNIWTPKHRKQFEDIFFQKTKKFDSSARTLALDIILDMRPITIDQLKPIVQYLRSADKEFEVKQYVLQKLQMLSDQCSHFREIVKEILSNDPNLNNYHIIGQKGLTTALTRQFSKAPSFNGTLLSVQEIYGGVLKRGIVDMTIMADKDQFSVFTLGLYAGGLSSFIGGNGNDNGDGDDDVDGDKNDESANAGMEVTVQRAYFRPLQFFNGQGELMGHVWSGTASTPTPAYTATTMLYEHEETIRLQNGAGLGISVLGAISIDLNGQVQFSLWNRNSHCQVDKNAGIALYGTFGIETSFINVLTHFTVTKEPKLNLVADIDFASDVKLCIQLSQPNTILWHTIEKIGKIHGTNHDRQNKRTMEYRLAGYTHALNQKNNEMCSMIINS